MTKDKQEAFETFEFELPPIRGFPELRWAGKRPFKSTQFFPAQKKESYGDPTDGWWNRIYWGDNLQVMSHLLREFRGAVRVAYIDPPYDSDADYKKTVSVKGKTTKSDLGSFEEKQYSDIWNFDQYLQFMRDRITLIKELLTPDGVVFVHCDDHQSHRLRLLLDEVFGPERFINEIIWVRSTNPKGSQYESTRMSVFTDTIFCYGKSSSSRIYPDRIRIPLNEDEILQKYKYEDELGRYYDGPIVRSAGMGDRENMVYEYKGYTPPSSGWRMVKQKLIQLDEQGNLGWTANGNPFRKLRPKNDKGKPIGNFWNDISLINSQAAERVGYPTQKPVQLVERILTLGSNPGDLVLDAFMGSGTTSVAAVKLGRRFVGGDINLGAVETTVRRLQGLATVESREQSELFDGTEDDGENAEDQLHISSKIYRGFQLYNVNNYDLFRNPVEAKELIRDALELQPLPIGSMFDGQRDQYLVKIMPVNRVATRQDLNEIINAFDVKSFERRRAEFPNKPVERVHLVCMGHEPDLAAELQKQMRPYEIEVLVTDLIRDKAHLHFKKSSDAKLAIENGQLVIKGFYPMNLLQKLSLESSAVDDWRQLVESVKVDWNYDGAVLTPQIVDAPEKDQLVAGAYAVPKDAATIRVKITDLLSESWEGDITNG